MKYIIALIILIAVAGGGYYFYQHSQSTNMANQNSGEGIDISFSLLGDTYKKGFTLPGGGTDFSAESYEWVKGDETVDNWQTLVTTHKLSPLSVDKPLKAEAYAQNVVSTLKTSGAEMIETSVINTKDAADSGVDISNPPYLLVYVFPPAKSGEMAELDIQKIENTKDGKVTSFIYAEKMKISSQNDLDTFLATKEYSDNRSAVLLAKFPY